MFGSTEDFTLEIEGMHCAHCKASVETALKAVHGVKRVTVSLEEKRAQVTAAAGKTNREILCAAVIAAGFEAR